MDDYYSEDPSSATATATYPPPPVTPVAPVAPFPSDHLPSPVVEKKGRGRGRRKAAQIEPSFAEVNPTPTIAAASDANAPRNVVIKTKFPVARIKRIMQADEDVGKVAQVTPVVVSKALELFMIALCDKASAQARQRNSKRINAGHLKEAVRNEVQFDFLQEIIEKIPNIPDLPTESSHQSNGGDSEDGAAPVKKQRRPRQKKIKDDDAFPAMET